MKTTVNSQEIFVGDGGVGWRADQRTLVLQHGAGMNRTVWVLLTRYFARHGYNVVAADLPGHGASGGQILSSVEAQAEHLWAMLDSLHATHGLPVDSVVLAGHSMGALLVVEAASQRRHSVDDLLLFGVGYPMAVAQALLDAAEANSQTAVDMIAIYSHSLASRLGHNPVAGISAQNTAMAMLEQAAPGVLHADLMACNDYRGLEKACALLADADGGGVRCTVISGDSDQMTPMKSTRKVVELLKAEHRVLRDCGHMMMSEQPEQTLQAARSVLL